MEGFSQDGVKYANFFCNENFSSAVFFPNTKPITCGYLIEREMKNGTKIGYLSALSTKKEYRGLGFASSVIFKILNNANEKKYPFVLLGPFNSTYYKKYGFFDFDKREKRIVSEGNVIARLATINDIDAIKSLFSSDGFSCVFDKYYYEKLERESCVTNANLYTLCQEGRIVGFCVKGKNFISNIISKNDAIGNCTDFCGLEYLSKSENGEPFLQMRVTDVREFLQLFTPTKEFSIRLKVTDCIIESNNLVLRIFSKDNHIEIENVDEYEVELDVKDLYGYLINNGFIKKVESEFIDNY